MADRITKWLLFTVLFAFIPITISALISFTTDVPIVAYRFSNELLFSVIMLSAVSLGDVVDLNKKIPKFVLTIFIASLVLLVILSAVLYGSLLSGQSDFSGRNLFTAASVMALISFIAGTAIQILLGLKRKD